MKKKDELLSFFINKLQVYEVDIGDFKRKACTYLNNFEEEMSQPSLRSSFSQIRSDIICNTTLDITSLREHIIKKTKESLAE